MTYRKWKRDVIKVLVRLFEHKNFLQNPGIDDVIRDGYQIREINNRQYAPIMHATLMFYYQVTGDDKGMTAHTGDILVALDQGRTDLALSKVTDIEIQARHFIIRQMENDFDRRFRE